MKGKKQGQVEEVDGDPYRYFLLAGTSHPYPDDTFYSVGRVPRKLLMKYLGVKMYLVRLKQPPVKVSEMISCTNTFLANMTSSNTKCTKSSNTTKCTSNYLSMDRTILHSIVALH